MHRLRVTVFTVEQNLCSIHQVLRYSLDLLTDITDDTVTFQITFHISQAPAYNTASVTHTPRLHVCEMLDKLCRQETSNRYAISKFS